MIDLNKRNTPFAESIMNCGATFLNPDTTPSLCYSAAKQFVDEYEREQHEQRHEAQKRELSYEDFECLLNLAEVVRRKLLPDKVCDEEKHESPKPKVEEPKIGEVYRDIFGNMYLIIGINDEEPVKKSFVTLIYFNASGDLRSSELFTVPLEDFMNPTFQKE